jgi:hypothetical protein
MDTAFRKPMPRGESFSRKRRQNNDREEENCASKKKRKGKPERTNVYPLGEMSRREEQR